MCGPWSFHKRPYPMLKRIRKQFFDIKRDEWPTALALALFFFLVIAVFWVLKPIKRAVLISQYAQESLTLLGWSLSGAEAEQLGKVLNLIVVYGIVVVYTLVVRHFSRTYVVTIFAGALSAGMVFFATVINDPGAPVAWSFYVFGDMFNSIMVATFWAFASDITTSQQSKRIYGIVGLGGVVGGFVGATVVQGQVETLGRAPLLLACVGAMAVIVGIAFFVQTCCDQGDYGKTPSGEPGEAEQSVSAATEGARLVFQSKYLIAILGMIGFYEVVSNIVDFQLATVIEQAVQDPDARAAYFGLVGQVTGIGSIVVQLLLTGFVMNRFGVGVALLFLPAAILMGTVGFLVMPTLAFATAMSASDNSLNYSINQSAKEALYTPLARDVVYKAKAFIDMFVQRFAKVFAVVLNLAFAAYVGLEGVRWLSLASLLVLVGWIGAVRFLGRRFRARAESQEEAATPVAL